MAGVAAERGSPANMEAKAKPPKLDCLRKSLRDPVGFILVKISELGEIKQGPAEVWQAVLPGIAEK